MNGEFSYWNWVVLVLYIAGVFAIGLRARKHQKTSEDFFLAGRSMGWLPVGISMVMTVFSAISYTATINQSYYYGPLLIMSMVMVWIDAPVICLIVIPFFYNLKLYSIYEYLEKRFSLPARLAASMTFLFWRMLWLAAVVLAPCKVMQVVFEIALEVNVPIEYLIFFVGTVTIIYTTLGGMRAVIWTDVAQAVVMLGSIVAILAVVWSTMHQGPVEVWEIAKATDHDKLAHTKFDLADPWCLWGIIPFYFLARLAFYGADQIIVQRVMTAKSLKTAQRAFLINCVGLTIFTPLLIFVGMNLHAFYQKHPDRIPRQYQTHLEKTITLQNGEKISRETAWAKKHPTKNEKLEDKILPTFIVRELPVVIAGLVISALFAACMSTMDSGLNAVTTVLIVDFHRRLGIGKKWLARRLKKPVDKLDEADELKLARPLLIGIGFFAMVFGCWLSYQGTIFEIARSAIDTPGIPLACVFLLGMLTRRTNTVGGLSGLIAGVLTIVWLTFGRKWALAGVPGIWPWDFVNDEYLKVAPIYPGVAGAIVTVAVGYGVSLIFGQQKTKKELTGLVWRIDK